MSEGSSGMMGSMIYFIVCERGRKMRNDQTDRGKMSETWSRALDQPRATKRMNEL